MTAIEITCRPGDGILAVSAETVSALDLLGLTLPRQRRWTITVHLDDPFYPAGVTLTATPHTDTDEESAT